MSDHQTSPQELKPCPFCGEKAVIHDSDWNGPQFFVACYSSTCYCSLGENYDRDACPDHQFASAEDAAAAWNRRTP